MTHRALIINVALVLASGLLGYQLHGWQAAGQPASMDEPVAPPTAPTAVTPTDAEDPVIARINDEDVRKSEIVPYLQDVASTQDLLQWGRVESVPVEIYQAALLGLARDRLLRARADAEQITRRPEIRALMSKSTNQIARLAYLEELGARLVDESEVERRYAELSASLAEQQEYRARHILVREEAQARALIEEMDRVPFADLAARYSLDAQTGARGGDLGYFIAGSLDADFERVVTGLEPGALSEPFQTRFGWHIAILDEQRDAQAMTYEQAAPIIRERLERAAIQDWLNGLLAEARITPLLLDPPTAESTEDSAG
jgi:peptidyl-prolyl cis-trans isomerase C